MACSDNQMFLTGVVLTATDAIDRQFKLRNNSKEFVGWIKTTATNGATTVTALIEHSPNGEDWYTAITFTPIVGANTSELIQVNSGTVHLLPYVRSSVVLSGATQASTVTCGLFFSRDNG